VLALVLLEEMLQSVQSHATRCVIHILELPCGVLVTALKIFCIRYLPVVGTCEHSNEPSGSIKGKEFRD